MKIKLSFLNFTIIFLLFSQYAYANPLGDLINGLKEIQNNLDNISKNSKNQALSTNISNKVNLSTDLSKTVEVVGVGETLDTSKEDAVRQAVQKTVGSYVSSDLIVKNDIVIKDKVISLSAAFVEKTEVLTQLKREDGLYETKIRATVSSNKLRKALEDNNIATTDLDSESLFGEALSKLDNTNSIIALWAGMMKKFPESAVKTTLVGKPNINPMIDDDVLMSFTAVVSWESNYRDEFIRVMKLTGDIITGKHDTPIDLGYESENTPVSLEVKNKILEHNISQLINKNTKSLSINLNIKNASGEVVGQIKNCLSKNYKYQNDPTNPFISHGSINVFGFPYEQGFLDIYSSKYSENMKIDFESRKFWLEAKNRNEFFLHVNEVVKRDLIKEFKTLDIVIGECSSYSS